MVRLAISTALVALVVLSTVTAQNFYYVISRMKGDWLKGHHNCDDAPIFLGGEDDDDFNIWRFEGLGDLHYIYNHGSKCPVVSSVDGPVKTTGARAPPSYVRIEWSTLGYRIKDFKNELYWTLVGNEVVLRTFDSSGLKQLWDLVKAK